MYITAILKPEESVVQTTNQVTNTTPTSDSFSDCLSEVQSDNSLSSIFKKASETYGVSMSLLTAMAKQESNFQADATSKSGAMGIMQLMPSTAEFLGCKEPYNPEQNIMAGAKYISQLLDKYDGNVPLALAAYNAGSGNVEKYGGIPPFEETQNYVAKITAYMEEGISLPDGTAINGSSSSDGTSSIAKTILEKLDSNDFKDILNQLFSYEDYLKFMNLLLKELGTITNTPATGTSQKSATDNKTSGNATSSSEVSPQATDTNSRTDTFISGRTLDVTVTSNSDAYYAYQNINYNNSVLNLMSQTNKTE